MTHPAQARDALARMGYTNVYILTDGLVGFSERILKPASLRAEPLSADQTARINAWRQYFSDAGKPRPVPAPAEAALPVSQPIPPTWPGLVEPAWLSENLGNPEVRVIEVRPQPQYNSGHIPGSVCVSPENFRGVVGGVSSMLQPADLLARHMSLMGIRPTDRVVIVPDDKPHDATLVAMAFARLGHARFGILNGGFPRWTLEKRPVTTELPQVQRVRVPGPPSRPLHGYVQAGPRVAQGGGYGDRGCASDGVLHRGRRWKRPAAGTSRGPGTGRTRRTSIKVRQGDALQVEGGAGEGLCSCLFPPSKRG